MFCERMTMSHPLYTPYVKDTFFRARYYKNNLLKKIKNLMNVHGFLSLANYATGPLILLPKHPLKFVSYFSLNSFASKEKYAFILFD